MAPRTTALPRGYETTREGMRRAMKRSKQKGVDIVCVHRQHGRGFHVVRFVELGGLR